MNIDVRNIDSDWINAIEGIKKIIPEINTNTKAIRYASIQFEKDKKKISSLEKEILALENKIDKLEEQQKEAKAFFKLQNKLSKVFT